MTIKTLVHIAINTKMFNNNASKNPTTTKDASNVKELILEKILILVEEFMITLWCTKVSKHLANED